jgi:hypothetical protein
LTTHANRREQEIMAKNSNDNPQDLPQMSLGGIVVDLPAVRALPGTRLVNNALQWFICVA